MTRLQNPSPFSRFSPLLSFDNLPRFYNFFKWGALILALLDTLTRFLRRIKLFIHRVPVKSIVSYQESCYQQIYDDDDFDFDVSDDDDEDDTSSWVTDSNDESEDYQKPAIEVFRAEGCSCYCGDDGNFTLRRGNRFLWSEYSAGESVVQLWDSLGFGLDVKDGESEFESHVDLWELGRDVRVSSGEWCRSPLAAGNGVVKTDINRIYDACGGYGDTKTSAAICSAWRPAQRKVCVKDGGADVVSVTESESETWWEGDGVFVPMDHRLQGYSLSFD